MRTSVIIPGNGESFRDFLIQKKLRNPKLKFLSSVGALEKEFGNEKAKVMRGEAAKRDAQDHQDLGEDF